MSKKKKQQKRYRQGAVGVTTRLLRSARLRAKKKGREFELEWDWIKKKVDHGICEKTGLPFNNDPTEWSRSPWAPSLHRVDSRRGYSVDNVVVVVWIWNQSVGQYDESALETMMEAWRAKTQET